MNNDFDKVWSYSSFIKISNEEVKLNSIELITSTIGVASSFMKSSKSRFRLTNGLKGELSFKIYTPSLATGRVYGGGGWNKIKTFKISGLGFTINNVASVFSTGMAFVKNYNGDNVKPIDYLDAGIGTAGLMATSAEYFSKSKVPFVGQFVSIWGIGRLTWDVCFSLGYYHGLSTWIGEDDNSYLK